jgi:hypothetical protein
MQLGRPSRMAYNLAACHAYGIDMVILYSEPAPFAGTKAYELSVLKII